MKLDTQESGGKISTRDKHSGAKRIWHWCSSLAIMSLLCTVFIASTLLKPRQNAPVIQDKLQEKGVVVTTDQARAVAKTIGKPVWIWHKYIGVGLAVLFLLRIVLELFEPEGQSLKSRIRKGALYLRQARSVSARHYLFVKYIYLLFYVFIGVLVVTGLGIIYSDDFSVLKEIKENLKDIHSFCMYGVMGFIVLHIGGILRAELTASPGISSDMIHGGNPGKGS